MHIPAPNPNLFTSESIPTFWSSLVVLCFVLFSYAYLRVCVEAEGTTRAL
jgi:hypothetical protein